MSPVKYEKVEWYACLATSGMLLILGACTTAPTQPTPNPTPIVAEDTTVVVPPQDMLPCDKLPTLEPREYSQVEVTTFLGNWANLYTVCAGHHEDLRRIAGQAFRIPGIPAPDAK